MHRSCPAAPPHLPPICRQVETLKQRKKEEREKEKQSGDMTVNEVQVQLDKMKAETKVSK